MRNLSLDHESPINHKGSAGTMEASGVLRIYEKSVKNLKLRYMTYIGDGDSKAYPSVVRAQPYGPNKIPVKGECVGHVQKRVGGRLRKYKKDYGNEVLSDGKKLGDIGRLTDKWMNNLQNYYGLAIRQNTDSLNKMRKAVGAGLYHCSKATTTAARHQFCGKDSERCKTCQAEKVGELFADKPGLPLAARDKIMPIFQFEKCLHGKTQNNNEGLNSLIWKRLPKVIFVGAYFLEMGVCSSIFNFNSGACRMLQILKLLGLTLGYYTKIFCEGQLSAKPIENVNVRIYRQKQGK